jgi:hypothetical protein
MLAGAAGTIEAALGERVGTLLADLRLAMKETTPPLPVPDPGNAEVRLQALRALEDDILRLERLLRHTLQD